MKEKLSIAQFKKAILKKEISALSHAITLAESKRDDHQKFAQDLIQELLPYTGKSKRIAVTGVPGVGKSTFINSFGLYLIEKGYKIAVLAIDPSSAISGGSILGDKTRMEDLTKSPKAYIRPSANSGTLGGITSRTYENILLCEAAGFDIVLVETVGVGQSEILVKNITDCFLYLKVLGTGDDLQGIKRGIMETADIIFLNKIEEEQSQKAKVNLAQIRQSVHLFPKKKSNWRVQVLSGSGLNHLGFDVLFESLQNYFSLVKTNGFLTQFRNEQDRARIKNYLQELLQNQVNEFWDKKNTISPIKTKSPYFLAKNLIQEFKRFVLKKEK